MTSFVLLFNNFPLVSSYDLFCVFQWFLTGDFWITHKQIKSTLFTPVWLPLKSLIDEFRLSDNFVIIFNTKSYFSDFGSMTGSLQKKLNTHWARSVPDKRLAIQLLRVTPFIFTASRSTMGSLLCCDVEEPFAVLSTSNQVKSLL